MVEMNRTHNTTKAPRRRGRKGKSDEVETNDDDEGKTIFKPHRTMLIQLSEEEPTWHQCGNNTQHRNETVASMNRKNNTNSTNPHHIVLKYRSIAESIYRHEVNLFRSSSSDSDKDEQWVESTMRKGTLKDRIAAMSVVVSSHPVHKLYALDLLLDLAGVSTGDNNGNNNSQTNERVSQMASEALTDLFTSTLLPSDRKLIGLDSRPLYLYEDSKLSISPRTLLLWKYEEMMKNRYHAFLTQHLGRTLAQSGTASLDLTKISCLRTASTLLKELPEGEQTLLSLVVNKIGDPSKKVASSASHELRRILETHPNMTNILAREVQQLAHRPNLSTRALYNCIIFLNQLKLVKEEETEENDETLDKAKSKFSSKISLPASLINTYFQIFEVAVNKGKYESGKGAKKKKDTMTQDLAMKGRLLGALLTGVNRAHPYLPSKDTGMEQHVDSLYRISHVSPPAACTQALMLLFHLAVGSSADNMKDDLQVPKSINSEGVKPISSRKDRFYRVLYTKLSDPSMFVGRQLTLFFNLIYKSMKYDNNEPRVVAFAKRLLHIAFHQAPSVISGVLFLLSEVMNYQPLLKNGVNLNVGHGHVFDSSKREPSAAFTSLDEKESEKDSNVSPSNRIAGSIWEMSLTVNHYHPTVSKFTSSVNEINYRGDPLRDFGLVPFLDKFAFKNPKSSEKITQKLKRGESVGERRSGLQGNISALSSLPVNDPNFWKEQSTVSEQDEFFKAFFTERAKRDQFKGVVRGKKQDNGNEMDALEANEEARDMDVDWDTDEEEEAFVEKLAESLMENSNEKVNYDDEDPDMGDWSDYGGSDQEEENKLDDNDEAAGESYLEKIGFTKPKGLITVLGDVSDDDSDVDKESSENEQDSSEEIDEDAADEDDRSNNDDDDDELINEFASDDLLKDENSDDDDDDDREDDNKVQKKTKKNSSEMLSMFADASDYEELITASLKEPKGTMPKRKLDEQGDANVTPVSTKSSKRKRRKRNKSNK